MASPRKAAGFTLFELMLTIGIGAVLMGLAAPSITEFLRASRLSASSRDLVVDLALARNEAVMRGRRVSICASESLTSCDGADWTAGRLVFVDGGASGAVNVGDTILTRTPPLDETLTTSATGIANATSISFGANGRLTGLGQITVCTPGEQRRRVTLSRAGQSSLNRINVAC